MSRNTTRNSVTGDEALALGALDAGVRVVTSYPGSPGAGTVNVLLSRTDPDDLHVEWSVNEKVALEVGIGASLAGHRALVCVKSVGMNALVDPLMTVTLTGVRGGLVILLGDDPGAWGSQNDQDTRPLAAFAELPLLEPATPADGVAMMTAAFALAEKHGTIVIVRETRSFSACSGCVDASAGKRYSPRPPLDMVREPYRWVSYPANAVAFHRRLHERFAHIEAWVESSEFNVSSGEEASSGGPCGVVGAGFAHHKLEDVAGATGLPRVFKLGTIHPLPDDALAQFMAPCEEVLVLEENAPIVETALAVIAHRHGLRTRILGKLTAHIPREGELFRWQIREALEGIIDGFVPAGEFTRETESAEWPTRVDHCAGCPYLEILQLLIDTAGEAGIDPVIVGDPGCLVKASRLLDAKFAMGSAAAVVQGMAAVGLRGRAVAVFGDSAFFHSGLLALINAVQHRAAVLMIVLDNSATVTTGFQPNPGTGRDARGREAPAVSIEAVTAACGVKAVRIVGPGEDDDRLRTVFREGLQWDEPGVIVVRRPCTGLPAGVD